MVESLGVLEKPFSLVLRRYPHSLAACYPTCGDRTKISIMVDVMDGVNYMHSKGIIHRDLKPGNVLIDEDGSARIADMGLAHDIRTNGPPTDCVGEWTR